MTPFETTLGVLAAAGIVAWLLRGKRSEDSEAGGEKRGRYSNDELVNPVEPSTEPEDPSAEAVAITSEGWSFLPHGDAVHLVPPGEPEEEWTAKQKDSEAARVAPVHPTTGHRLASWRPGEHYVRGDLIAARVKRGAPDFGAWRVEGLGREGDYREWPFETEEAARAACALLEKRIVRPPVDEDGEPIPVDDAQFAEARRTLEETEEELANMPEDEGEEPRR